jgi:putative membrane protein
MMFGFSGIGMLGGFFMMVLWVVILVTVVYLVLHLLEKITGKHHTTSSGAERILQERFARGDIDFETYEKMKQHLKK